MRWNCPHCGSSLAAADEKVGVSWSFSRCYKCGGFALVRRSDTNLIKVDRAPAGESVILPEAHENPTTMLSGPAAERLAQYTGKLNQARSDQNSERARQAALKPTIRTAIRRAGAQAEARTAAQPLTTAATPIQAAAAPTQTVAPPPAPVSYTTANPMGLPDPLPEAPETSWAQKLVPLAVGAAGMLSIASGIYLYVQGQALWEKARGAGDGLAPPPQAEQAGTLPPSAPVAPKAAQASALTDARPPLSGATSASSGTTSALPATTHIVAQSANVGQSGSQPISERVTPSGQSTQPAQIPTPARISQLAPSATIASAPTIPARTEIIDEVHAPAMAPQREPLTPAHAETRAEMRVETLLDHAHVHANPNIKAPTIATLPKHHSYAVADWRDRWFKIVVGGQLQGPITGWIRNDLVKPAW